ncbi:MAG: FG-GAP-like repeat-containing protein [Candidatus Eisenbacteria bacterium]
MSDSNPISVRKTRRLRVPLAWTALSQRDPLAWTALTHNAPRAWTALTRNAPRAWAALTHSDPRLRSTLTSCTAMLAMTALSSGASLATSDAPVLEARVVISGASGPGMVVSTGSIATVGTTASIEAETPGARTSAAGERPEMTPSMQGDETGVSSASPGAVRTTDAQTVPPVMPGWPQLMGSHPNFAPVGVLLADADGDGDLEVFAGSTDNFLYAWDHAGTALPGFPVNVGGQVQSKVAAADLDGDGDLEILVAVKSGQLRVLHHDGTPMTGWPQATGFTYGFLAPSVYDLDGNGTPEVLIGGGGNVRAWTAAGVSLPGWPKAVSGNVTGKLAIGDVTGDQVPEIFAVSTAGELYAFEPDGTVPAGWPATFGLSSSWAAPSIGDLDHDGVNEVCVVGYQFGVSTSIYAFRGDGSVMPGFPVNHVSGQTYSCPVLADVDGDDDLEIFNAGKINGPAFYAFDHLGNVLPGWPVTADPNMEGSAVVADFDGLPGMEIAIGDNLGPGNILGYNVDGTTATDFPIPKSGASLPNSPELGDVDHDGDLDMAMTTSDGRVTLWDLSRADEDGVIEWGALFHDDWNTNQYGFVVPTRDPASAPEAQATLRLEFGATYPNPLHARSATIPLSLAQSGVVRVTVHDPAGRVVRTLFTGALDEGVHHLNWDGLDAAGREVASGAYYLRVVGVDGAASTRTLTVVR